MGHRADPVEEDARDAVKRGRDAVKAWRVEAGTWLERDAMGVIQAGDLRELTVGLLAALDRLDDARKRLAALELVDVRPDRRAPGPALVERGVAESPPAPIAAPVPPSIDSRDKAILRELRAGPSSQSKIYETLSANRESGGKQDVRDRLAKLERLGRVHQVANAGRGARGGMRWAFGRSPGAR